MRASVSSVVLLILLVVNRPVLAGDGLNILGELRTSSTVDSLHVDYHVFVKDRVDSLVLDFWEPVRIFDARDPLASSAAETLQVKSLFEKGDGNCYPYHLHGCQSWPRNGRGNPSRIWLVYWYGKDPAAERESKRKFWELNEFSVGLSFQPLIIVGSSFNYYAPSV